MLVSTSLPTVPANFIDEVKKRNPPLVVEPNTSLNEIMFDAGKQSIIRWLESMTPKSTVHGAINRDA